MKYNIIWIILDGVRNYPSPDDPQRMGRPEIFDRIAEEGVYFEQSVVSAPSTYMSISAMMLGIPSYYLSRNLEDFKLDKSHFESLANILGNHGYTTYSISVFYDIRRKSWRHILPPISEKHWPKGEKRMLTWTNDPINPTIINQLNSGVDEPFFLFVHYNARRDSGLSLRVENLLNELKNRDLYDDSIIIICSDHGMPDSSRSDYFKWLRERELYFNRHDLVLTDDNILVPLFIKYPGSPKGKKITPAVGTIDISPTILDIIGIEFGPKTKYGKSFRGESLLPLINGENEEYYRNRKFRTDTRYIAQNDRIISIRGSDYKYVSFRDIPGTENEQFYDLKEDPFESDNLIDSDDKSVKNKIKEYREELEWQEKDALIFQREFLLGKFKNKVSKLNLNSLNGPKPKILLFGTCHESFLQIAFDAIKMKWNDADIDYIAEPYAMPSSLKVRFRNTLIFDKDRFDHRQHDFIRYIEEYDYVFVPLTDYVKDIKQSQGKSTEGDMQIVQAQEPINNSITRDYKSIFKIAKKIKSNGVIYFDYNMEVFKNPRMVSFNKYVEKMIVKRDIYLYKPSELFHDIKRFVTGDIS